jgi:hypothetical protein
VRLLLHAIARVDSSPPDLAAGLRNLPPLRVDEAGLSAWATPLAEAGDALGRADLLAHHAIVSEIDERADGCLPARFPTWVEGDALRELLRARQVALSTGLERVRGRAELAVTVVWTSSLETTTPAPAASAAPPETSTPGRRYLVERRQAFAGSDRQRERARELADELERVLGADLVGARHQLNPSRQVALSSALLVPRARAEGLKMALALVKRDVRILVNGPWPAYTFATWAEEA